MKNKNPYRKKSRIGIVKSREIIKYFSMDFPAVKTTELTGLNHKTIDDWYRYIREIIFLESEQEKKEKCGQGIYELDESYFGPKRIRGKRGRGAGGKTIVFGLLKRDGKVYTEIVPDAKAKSLIPIIRGKIDPGSIINTDGWRAYSGLVEMGYEKHYRVHHGENEFARGKKHINGIESFWSFTKRRFTKFNGIKKEFFHLYLKESEYRYNVRISGGDLYKNILKMLRKFNP